MQYSTQFEESQHFSPTFNSFAGQLADEISAKCELEGKHVVEIGCGKGEFLVELCRRAEARGLGIDPGYRVDAGRCSGAEGVTFDIEYFGPQYKTVLADVVLCRHTLEHIAPVRDFVRSIREMLGRRAPSWAVFETPDFARVLREAAFWDVYYEHCSYLSVGSHARLFREQRFDVCEIRLDYDSQYIIQYASPAAEKTTARFNVEHDLEDLRELAGSFQSRAIDAREGWWERLRAARREGRRVVLWGGGSKAVSFLTTLNLNEEVEAAVDVNPYKQGKFTPGTGHRIVAPESLIETPPDLVIVMNPVYVGEVTQSLEALGLRPEIAALGV
jgi:SAM-dependent methyltransferase